MKRNLLGFTLIELLIVVSVIGVLAGATVGLLNLETTKERARDGVRQANLEKVIQAIESFYVLEDRYPVEDSISIDHNPLAGDDGPALSTYLKQWPSGDTGSYIYDMIDTDNFSLGVANASGKVYKYHSSWGSIQECSAYSADDQCGDAAIVPGGTDPADTVPPGNPGPTPPNPCTDSACATYCTQIGYTAGRCQSGACACSNR